ncbi:MAG TPA: flagellar motor switch protein FliG [Clostridia bacterium]|nr:flagellar motor switch protein FliG [Clostridia bacterium]
MQAQTKESTRDPAAETGAATKMHKLAALLVMLGPESAAAILRHFQPREIEAVSREMVRGTLISRSQQETILRDFAEVALAASTGVSSGIDVARTTLEKALGTFKASDVLGRVAPAKAGNGTMQAIAEMDPRHVFNLIRDEQPQTIAFVISHLAPDKAAQLLSLLPPEQRDAIVERLATLAPTPVEVAERVVEVLHANLGAKQTRALSQTGGVTTAADVLNAVDKNLSRALLGSIEQRNPELSQAIRKKMFTFEDLLLLDPHAVQRIMREIDMRDLTIALKRASEPLRKLLLASLSRRAAEAVQEEMAFLGQVKLREVEAAQFRIIDAVRKLEAEGEIELENAESVEYEMV